MPPAVLAQLRQLGQDLTIARQRRKESRRVWALRLGVSEPTVMRMERGDPAVSMGLYASALWLINRSQALAEIATPALDQGALEVAVRSARARPERKKPSIEGRLAAATLAAARSRAS